MISGSESHEKGMGTCIWQNRVQMNDSGAVRPRTRHAGRHYGERVMRNRSVSYVMKNKNDLRLDAQICCNDDEHGR